MINTDKIISLLNRLFPDVVFMDGYAGKQRKRNEKRILCALYTEITEDKFDGYEREKLRFDFFVRAADKNRAAEIFGAISDMVEDIFCLESEIEAVAREKAYASGEYIILPCSVMLKRAKPTKLSCIAFEGDTIWDISQRSGMDVELIAELNPELDLLSIFKGGERIRIRK